MIIGLSLASLSAMTLLALWIVARRSLHIEKGLRITAEAHAERLPQVEQELRETVALLQNLQIERAQLETRFQESEKAHAEKLALLKETEAKLSDSFKALSSEALQSNNKAFLDLAKTNLEKFQQGAQADLHKRQDAIDRLVKPVQDSLTKFETRMGDLDKARTEGQATLRQQVTSLAAMQSELQRETAKLSTALRSTTARGRWGEVQLRRIIELAGMTDHCDFYEQLSSTVDDGRRRPDLVVRLPSDRLIVIDAKAPLDAYLEANEASSESERKVLLKKHASTIRTHIRALASKGYTEHFTPSPEFVVLFLPGEYFFSAALIEDPSLIEVGAEQNVILATPTTLISLLRAVSHGWRQESLSQNAQKISEIGKELYKRLSVMANHWGKVGKNLESAVRSYNDAVGSMERRVLPKAREFEQLEATPVNNLELPNPVDHTPRELSSSSLVD